MQPLTNRSAAGWMFATAGAALLAAQALLPAMPSDAAHQVAAGVSHHGAVVGSAVAFLVAGVLIALGVAAGGSMPVARGRTLAKIGLVLTGIGALWPVAGRAAFNAILATMTGSTGHATAVSAMHAVGSSSVFSMFLPLLLAFIIGPVLLTLGLWRAGALPIWPALLWFVGVVVVNGAEASSRVGAVIGMALVAVALGWIGRGFGTSTTAEARAERDDLVPAL